MGVTAIALWKDMSLRAGECSQLPFGYFCLFCLCMSFSWARGESLVQALRGFAAGGQFMRAVVERCQHRGPRMHTLVTLGGQHQGVMNVPLCWNPSLNATPSLLCRAMQSVVGWGAYLPLIRDHLIQAQYFKVCFTSVHQNVLLNVGLVAGCGMEMRCADTGHKMSLYAMIYSLSQSLPACGSHFALPLIGSSVAQRLVMCCSV